MAYAEKETKALHEIYDNLNNGKMYCDYVRNVRFPYWHVAIWKGKSLNPEACDYGRDYFFWNHYGGSAERPTLKKLNWLIRGIFDMKPSEFVQKYEAKTQAEINAA